MSVHQWMNDPIHVKEGRCLGAPTDAREMLLSFSSPGWVCLSSATSLRTDLLTGEGNRGGVGEIRQQQQQQQRAWDLVGRWLGWLSRRRKEEGGRGRGGEVEGMTTPSVDATEAPSASVEKIQEELADITLDPPLNGNGGNSDEPTPAMVKPTEKSGKMMLFGGAISCRFPARFKDVSDVREVPNNQEAFVDPNRDESFIVELLELKENVADAGSARWFLEDLATEQGSEKSLVVEDESRIPTANVPNLEATSTVNTVIGTMTVAKGRQGPEASNLVRVYLANIRLKGVETDILLTVYEPLVISEHSESASSVGAGETVPATLVECMPAADVFKQVLSTFRIHDWTLFGYVDE